MTDMTGIMNIDDNIMNIDQEDLVNFMKAEQQQQQQHQSTPLPSTSHGLGRVP
jgi:hypothetical protein